MSEVAKLGLRCRVHKKVGDGIQITAAFWVTANPIDLDEGKIPCTMYPTALADGVTVEKVKSMLSEAAREYPNVKAIELDLVPVYVPRASPVETHLTQVGGGS